MLIFPAMICKKLKKRFLNTIKFNEGITLIELMIVITLISLFMLVIVPKFTNFFDSKQKYLNQFTAYISKTFDDSFIKGNINFLAVHLHSPLESDETGDDEEDPSQTEIFSRTNGLSVLRFEDGLFKEINNKILSSLEFPDSFKIDSVVLSNGVIQSEGTVLIPFYPDGYSDDIIIYIELNEEDQISVIINKYQKEPEIFYDKITFDDLWSKSNEE